VGRLFKSCFNRDGLEFRLVLLKQLLLDLSCNLPLSLTSFFDLLLGLVDLALVGVHLSRCFGLPVRQVQDGLLHKIKTLRGVSNLLLLLRHLKTDLSDFIIKELLTLTSVILQFLIQVLAHQQNIFLRGMLLLDSKQLIDFTLDLGDLRFNLGGMLLHFVDVFVYIFDLVTVDSLEILAQLLL
jgi:hypothetical protein